VAFDDAGNLFATDLFNQRAQTRSAAGVWKEWGGFGGRPGAMQFPRGIAVADDGTIVLTNSENSRIDLFTPGLAFIRSIRPSGSAFGWPEQTALAPDGSYWVADTTKNRVLHLGPTGTILRTISGSQIRLPSGIALDAAGNVYVANRGAGTVLKYSASGTLLQTLATGGRGHERADPVEPHRDRPAGSEVLLVADGGTVGSSPCPRAGPARLVRRQGQRPRQLLDPRSVAFDPISGTYVVADFGNDRLSRWG